MQSLSYLLEEGDAHLRAATTYSPRNISKDNNNQTSGDGKGLAMALKKYMSVVRVRLLASLDVAVKNDDKLIDILRLLRGPIRLPWVFIEEVHDQYLFGVRSLLTLLTLPSLTFLRFPCSSLILSWSLNVPLTSRVVLGFRSPAWFGK